MATQDELIQAELDGTIEELEAKENESDAEETEETADTEVKEKGDTAESTADETEEKPENTSDTSKKKDSVMKLLKQRNEARAKLAELEGKVQSTAELESRIKELEEGIAAQELEREAQKEKEDFYSKTPNAK